MPDAERLRALSQAQEPRARLIESLFLAPAPETTEILLIRHAQVPGGAMSEDVGLTDLGLEQAEALADFLAPVEIAAVYASPALRAWQTAGPLARQHGCDVEVIDGLRDMDSHLPAGVSLRETLVQEYGEAEAARRFERLQAELSFEVFGRLVEPSASLRGRVAEAIDDLVARHPGRRVVAVSHGPTIAAYVSHLLGSAADFVFYPRLTSITVVLARGGRRQLMLLNGMPHYGVL